MTSTELINPATEQVLRTVELLDAGGVDDAVARAKVAQKAWAASPPAERAAALRSFAAVVDAHIGELAALEVANSGHPIGAAEWEAGHVRDVLQFYSASPERLSGRQIPVAGGLDVTFNEPMGVIGIITPWNFPMPIASWGFAPALAAGNAVVLKPAEWTPLTSIRLGELAVEAGLPPGLFQVLPGKGTVVGERFITHPDIRKLVFTGSTTVGVHVMAGAAQQVKRVTLELGGKSANIIFDDCDLERAAATAPYGVFDNAGQDCCARSRILVQRNVFDRFMELLEPAVKGVVVGDPSARDTEMGPLVSRKQFDSVSGFVPDDAPVAFRGSAPSGPGYWFPPTVLTPGRDDRKLTPLRWRMTPNTDCPARSGPITCPARCGFRARSRPATSASTRTPRCAITPRSADSSNPAWAVNSARTHRSISPKPRMSSMRSERPNDGIQG